ncbi:ATP adenylyltransferase [Vulcanococcus limneticus]|uniref:ATP adenylyltransferase n=1 Tax=Vulcanococcus limneticus TaxID=2170428 RepID=UPI00398C1D46
MAPRHETYWQAALARSASALANGALVPLATELVSPGAWEPFLVRRLVSATPKHLRGSGPRPNPFLPWDPRLEVTRLADRHLLLLNKFPVQQGHVLLITQQWQPQAGWLDPHDWAAVQQVSGDTGGLWFFNSCAAAGASQPHRHLQLLPRKAGESSCPLAAALLAQLGGSQGRWPWQYRLSRRRPAESGAGAEGTAPGPGDLLQLYHEHAAALGLGCPSQDPAPRHPYNLLFDDDWFLTIRRRQEHWAGFSVNALGFAGCLLLTGHSDLTWLERHGPLALLQAVAEPEGS